MHKELEITCAALDELATAVTNAWGADTTVNEAFGWFAPAVTRHDLANLARTLAADIRSTDIDLLEESALKLFQDLPPRLSILQSNDHEGIASPRQMKDTVWGGGGTRSIKSLEHLF